MGAGSFGRRQRSEASPDSRLWEGAAGTGLALSLIFDRVAARWVAESSRDPLILGGVTAVLVVVSALACRTPARRAAAVDPVEALRYE
jgi:ABC-type antimicrobial peptide transport system permease subunit